ncbi:MAG TPA: CsbD family protein [Dyella sp.]|uniref:CsbD family protein n=1 Tax=Dyella sp. TaxID=1869338 RepID=UPI002C73491F|nr:CsbD family protein [Dyella sp.]HTV85364.1 CsbD family protein [Dyella sp.]
MNRNEDVIHNQWKQLSGNIKQHWGKLTDEDLNVADGSAEYLTGKLEQRYGMAHGQAQQQVREFEHQISQLGGTKH